MVWEGVRCNAPLAHLGHGVEFHHDLAAVWGGKGDLDNCLAICIPCHRTITRTRDVPAVAKVDRVRRKHLGLRRKRRFR